jgi:hypothetical protein
LRVRHAQTVTHGVRIETENVTDGFERVRSVSPPGAEPPCFFIEEPATSTVGGKAMLFHAIDRVLDDGGHQPLLWYYRPARAEVLRRQDDVGL